MRKLFCIVVMCVWTAAAYGEEASLIPEKTLRLSFMETAGSADGGFLANLGYGAEYGISNWLNLQLTWADGVKLHPDFFAGSMGFAIKGFILGEGALVSAGEKMRVSAALGLLLPPPDDKPDYISQDQGMWGSAMRIYGDYIINNYFFINLYYEGVFYPPQYQSSDVAEYRNWVRHFQDFIFELEGHFQYPLNNGFILRAGVPLKFFCAPYMNASDDYATSQYVLSSGAYVGLTFPGNVPPGELYLKYNANIFGHNIALAHRVSVVLKISLPPINKQKAENGEPEDDGNSE